MQNTKAQISEENIRKLKKQFWQHQEGTINRLYVLKLELYMNRLWRQEH